MAFDIEYFQKINNTYGASNKKETQLYQLKNHINNRFTDTIDCYNVLVNEISQDLIITRTINHYIKSIKTRPFEDFNLGDYVKWNNTTWMIIEKDLMNQEYSRGKMQLTNYTLKFQSPTGTILSYPCIDDSSFMAGLDEGKIITTLNGVHRIKLPFDDNTKLIGVGRRFFLDKSGTTTYEVTNVNNTTYNYGDKGLIELTLKQDSAYNPLTDKNGVCNYFEPTTDPKPPVEGYSVTVSTTGDLIAGSSIFRTFTPILKDNIGTVVEFTAIPVWTFDYGGMSPTDFTITYDGNLCKIKVVENYDYIGHTLRVICTTADELYSGYTDVLIMM